MARTQARGKKKRSKSKVAPKVAAGIEKDAAEELLQELARKGFSRAKIGGFDTDGVLRGKYVSLDKLRSALSKGFGFCDVIFGWDVNDLLYDNATHTGWHTGYPDAHAVLDAATLRHMPWEPGVAAMLCDFRQASGHDHPGCPRSVLKRVIARARKHGFEPRVAAEFEFFFFRENREQLREKGFRGLTPLEGGMFGYSWLRTGQDAELMSDIFEGMRDFDVELEGLHTETGPGVYEAAIRHDDALRAADKAALFKVALKQIAHRHGLSVTFMAKCDPDLPGCSGHIHESLWQNGANAFFDSRTSLGMSKIMKRYLAGQLALMRELTAMVSPTINSYKRYVPGVWAPLTESWGIENRTCTLRVIGTNDEEAARIEHRQPAADMNPYLAIAATVGAGLWGIEQELQPPPETKGDPQLAEHRQLPGTLKEATSLLSESKAARALFGKEFVEHYIRTREWEVRCYERAVTDWELARYFEVI